MEEKIINYALEHPVLFAIIVPVVLGVITSAFIEILKYIVFGSKPLDENEDKKVIDNIVWRTVTVLLSLFVAWLALISIGNVIESVGLKILFILLNSAVPFLFYHFKGRELLRLTLGKLFDKFNKTNF